MIIDQFLAALERLAPVSLAEEWDNVGLLVGRHVAPVSRILVALDLRDAVLDEAEHVGADVILTHHPAIFPSVTAVSDATVPGRLVLRAARAGIAVVAAHTNLDAARDGLNDQMADMLGLRDLAPLRSSPTDLALGLGRVGRTPAGTTLHDLVTAVGVAFAHPQRSFVGDPERALETVAVCTGSGASLIEDAVAVGADAYVTGDLKYHDADRAPGLALVGVPHGVVERAALREWTTTILARELGADVAVGFAATDTDPWTHGA